MDNASLITTPRGSGILTPTLPMFFRRRNIYATPCLNGRREELHGSRATEHVQIVGTIVRNAQGALVITLSQRVLLQGTQGRLPRRSLRVGSLNIAGC